jgi:uncharacterized protein YjbI with pentapeptide repeats
MRKWQVLVMISILMICGSIARATTAILINDEDLILSSRAIVRGRVTGIESRFDEKKEIIYTYITIKVEEVFKGEISSREIVIRQAGGQVGNFVQMVQGSPRFVPAERVLLYLNTASDGALQVAHLFMGKFTIKKDPQTGGYYVRRSPQGVRLLEHAQTGEITNLMELDRYREKIRATLSANASRAVEYEQLNAQRPLLAAPAEFKQQKATQYSSGPRAQNYRWFEADAGSPLIYFFNPNQSPVPDYGQEDFAAMLGSWTEISDGSIILQSGGISSSSGFAIDRLNTLSFEANQNGLEAPVNCAGIIALTSSSYLSGQTKSLNGLLYSKAIESDLVLNRDFACFLSDRSILTEVIEHEIGYSIGLKDYSNEEGRKEVLFSIYPLQADDPSIDSFDPATGGIGTRVIINGRNFNADVQFVLFSGTTASAQNATSNKVETIVPPGALTGPITVVRGDGKRAVSRTDFVVIDPRITSFSPTSGPAGTAVTITGANFTGATAVRFNGTSATFNVVSASQITTTVPQGATTGPISIVVPGATATSQAVFTLPAIINSFSPARGPALSNVIISGVNFTGSTAVRFNSTTANFTINSATQITAIVPQNATSGPISVTNGAGTVTSQGPFTIEAAIGNFLPASGSAGTAVTIFGTNLSDVSAVRFDDKNADFTIVNPTRITTTVPAGAANGPIRVVTPAGTFSSANNFTVTSDSGTPTINNFSPTAGPAGTAVTITGANFTGATAVRFNGTNANFTLTSATQINTTVPTGATSGPISIITPAGTVTSSASFTVTSQPVPTISGFSPTSGPIGAGVTITGANFTGTTAVRFNSTSANFTLTSATQITTTVPAGATTGPISIITPGGTVTTTDSFTVTQALPTISGFSPAAGSAGTSVTITGANFTGATAVLFNNTNANFNVISATQITTTVPAGATTGPISVITPSGTVASSSNFTISPPVTITTANYNKPNLVITGTGFGTSGTRVLINNSDVSSRIKALTDTSIMVKGNKKKLNLKSGANQVTVIANGIQSNTFVLNVFD